MKYKNIKPLVLGVVDDDGSFIENRHLEIEIGSVWELEKSKYRLIGGSDSIRLEDAEGRWIEIYKDDLANHFVRV